MKTVKEPSAEAVRKQKKAEAWANYIRVREAAHEQERRERDDAQDAFDRAVKKEKLRLDRAKAAYDAVAGYKSPASAAKREAEARARETSEKAVREAWIAFEQYDVEGTGEELFRRVMKTRRHVLEVG